MARKYISMALILKSVNSKTGSAGVRQYVDGVSNFVHDFVVRNSPVGTPLDREHDGRGVGYFKAMWRKDNQGSNGFWVRSTVYNNCWYARAVENGRSNSGRREVFSWSQARNAKGFPTPGHIMALDTGSMGRDGLHLINNAVAAAGARMAIGAIEFERIRVVP